ncbi:hypothetical protein BCR33DRAFT_775492 [Rhizoclosmatium globosum]|uniref:Uncharacterized protein n=1 Tax=Rhizoclosmatium globosum TaxID=329046 RepID=A0A1Y2AL44_9FUNG|nr:hypothetical protein BCR33DRAFT_775492 [Rhizoclosmatium globosum]|eukprot:ORY23000.1 hypothetical protein BCR33DRAFT_775492 [Rhizoclosmatium globosum]
MSPMTSSIVLSPMAGQFISSPQVSTPRSADPTSLPSATSYDDEMTGSSTRFASRASIQNVRRISYNRSPQYTEVDENGAFTLRLLGSVDFVAANSPKYFDTTRPDYLETKISNAAYYLRADTLNTTLVKTLSKQNKMIICTNLCWFLIVVCLIVDLTVSMPRAAQISIFFVGVLIFGLRYVLAIYTPTLRKECEIALDSWRQEDELQNVNLVYKLTGSGITFYEKVLDVETVEDLPAYVK